MRKDSPLIDLLALLQYRYNEIKEKRTACGRFSGTDQNIDSAVRRAVWGFANTKFRGTLFYMIDKHSGVKACQKALAPYGFKF